MSWHTIDVGPTRLFARRSPKLLSVGAAPFGLNLHRDAGISLSGLPRSGGTTICWGALKRRCEKVDADPRRLQWRDTLEPDAWVRCFGPLMIRVGSDF